MRVEELIFRLIKECGDFGYVINDSAEYLAGNVRVVSLLNFYSKVATLLRDDKNYLRISTKKCFSVSSYCPINEFFIHLVSIKADSILCLTKTALNLWISHLALNNKISKMIKKCMNCMNFMSDWSKKVFQISQETGLYDILSKVFDFSRIITEKDIIFCILSSAVEENKNHSSFAESLLDKGEILSTYKVGRDLEYDISIYAIPSYEEKIYQINFVIPDDQKEFLDNIGDFIIKEIKTTPGVAFKRFNDLLDDLNARIRFLIINKIKPGFEILPCLILRLSMKALQIPTIFPFLLDDNVEEIFCDAENDYLYLNHRIHGRCRTFYKLESAELNALITHVQVDGNLRFDYVNCKLIHTISNSMFTCRFSFDRSPLHQNICFDIRKMKRMPFKLSELIELGSLSYELAGFLIFCVKHRINITVAGETDSGKTTLLNALDSYTPSWFRKIYIEETFESLELDKERFHQLKYHVNEEPLDSTRIVIKDHHALSHTKSSEIQNLLHRSPDLIYLGEILTEQEAKAMFHCLSVGLVGFQTIHAKDPDSLINRWVVHFGITPQCLNDLGILVFMKKIDQKRKLVSISEIAIDNNDNPKINYIYRYLPEKQCYIEDTSLIQCKSIAQLSKYYIMDDKRVQNEIQSYISELQNENCKNKSITINVQLKRKEVKQNV